MGRTIDLTGEVVLGRENVDVIIDDPEISRRHLVLRPLVGAIEIEDLGSSNGTYVDDERIEVPTRVCCGQTIRLGATILEVGEVLHAEATVVRQTAEAPATLATPITHQRVRTASAIAPSPPTEPTEKPIQLAEAPTPPAPAPAPLGQFSPPAQRRSRGLASRSWVPVVLSFGTVVLTAIALVIYFATR
jgi:predicted component of type VI protein secretion system